MSIVEEIESKKSARGGYPPVQRWLERINDPKRREAWKALLEYAGHSEGKSRPTGKYTRESAILIEAIGSKQFQSTLTRLLTEFDVTERPTTSPWSRLFSKKRSIAEEHDLFRGLLWASQSFVEENVQGALADLASRAFRKIPEIGPAAPKLGNAALLILSRVEGIAGVAAISRVAAKVRYPSARKQIDRYLGEAAERAGISREELDELSVPTYDLKSGRKEVAVAGYEALVSIDGTAAKLRFRNEKGKELASVPKAVKEQAPEVLKALRKERKELEATLFATSCRLERLWMHPEPLTVSRLLERYLKHELVGTLASRLLWSSAVPGDASSRAVVIWRDGQFKSLGESAELPADAEVRLWHPIETGSLEEAQVWRDYLAELGVTSPFAQLYRDVYQAALGESDDRFAGHVLLQSALRSNCQKDGWTYNLQGHWDSANDPEFAIPGRDMVARFGAEPIAHENDDNHVFQYLVSGPVSFHESWDRGRSVAMEPLPLDAVDPLVFSEVMRMVSTMIARCSIAVDSGFVRSSWFSPYDARWRQRTWGALSTAGLARAEVLRGVIARTTLRDCAKVEPPWLICEAPTGPHGIHIGSGFVRDQADETVDVRMTAKSKRAAAEVFLPFEGDAILTLIVGRAFALTGAG